MKPILMHGASFKPPRSALHFSDLHRDSFTTFRVRRTSYGEFLSHTRVASTRRGCEPFYFYVSPAYSCNNGKSFRIKVRST